MVSNKKYQELLRENQELKEETKNLRNRYFSIVCDYKKECELYHSSLADRQELMNELNEYKQKYLDEQQKRLFFAEQVGKLESKLKDAERCGYTND